MWKPVIRATLVAPSADGTCCPCAALSDPCTCAGLAAEVRCRTRSALAVLVGGSEYTDPSDPPRKYLRVDSSGSAHSDYFPGGCAGSPTHSYECTYTGYYELNPRTGSVSASGYISCGGNQQPSLAVDGYSPLWSACDVAVTNTRTSSTWNPTGACCNSGADDYKTPTATRSRVLSKEYTERAALDDAWNPPAGPVQFSGWSDPLTEWPSCSALWELRSGAQDFDFAVRESQYQLRFPALTVTHQVVDPYTGETTTETTQVTAQVEVRIYILRRPWNGGMWVLYRTETYTLTATGGQTFEADVPNERGYETAINNVKYRIVS